MIDLVLGGDPYAAVLADLCRRRDEIENAIRVLESVRGGSTSVALQEGPQTPVDDAAGQFLGMSIGDAAKKLLGLKRRTLNSAEIAAGLVAGGLPMNASDPANVVGSVLTRRFNNVGDVVRVSRGMWGLADWYPNRSFRKKVAGKFVEPDASEVEGEPERYVIDFKKEADAVAESDPLA